MNRALLVSVAGPPAGIVDVWTVPLDAPALAHGALARTLDAGERRQAGRMRTGGRAWASAHGALRVILAHYLDLPASTLRFSAEASGKPRLSGSPAPEFSLAHTEGLAIVAVAGDRAVGADVERENDRTDIEAVARDFLPPGEAAALAWTGPKGRRSAFFAAWARHEARLKLNGGGLAGGAPATARASGQGSASGPPVVVRALAPRPGFAVAVAAEGGAWTIRVRRFPVSGTLR